MFRQQIDRRIFMQGSGTLFGSGLFRLAAPSLAAVSQAACSARDADAAFENLTDAEAREFVAIAARILPTTDTPGAVEAGAVYFADHAYGSFLADSLEQMRVQFAEFQSGISDAYPGAERFSDLDDADQDAWLAGQEHTPFFETAWFLTIAGTFAMSSYGGNRDNIGWKLLGMDGPPHAWTYPFGYYDDEYTERQTDGE